MKENKITPTKYVPRIYFAMTEFFFSAGKSASCILLQGQFKTHFRFVLREKIRGAVLQRLKFVFHLPIFPVFSVLGRITQVGRSKSQYLTDRLNKNDLKNN